MAGVLQRDRQRRILGLSRVGATAPLSCPRWQAMASSPIIRHQRWRSLFRRGAMPAGMSFPTPI